ncbi:unnamed protein product, partial [Lymnaea stagnalis]
MAASELARRGWYIKEDAISAITDDAKSSTDSCVKKALNFDLREIGAPKVNEDINRGRLDYVEGPLVLQLQKLRVISAPKDNEESQAAPKLCRLSLTDGHVTCSAVTLEPIKGLGVSTPPGSKILLSGTVEVETNFLLLTNKNTSLLGGRVDALADSWELKKTLAQQSLTRSSARGEGGPPPFVPFGKKIANDPLPPPRKDNFKSLGTPKEKKLTEEDSEFQQQRQAALNQALQAKSTSGGVKTFGGGKFLVNDKDVARITEMGFSVDEATSALKAASGNVSDAINSLLSGGQRYHRAGDRARGGKIIILIEICLYEGRGDGRRRGRDRDYDDDAEGPISTKPSGPATLFDFLETKIPTKEDAKKLVMKSAETKPLSSTSSSLSNESTIKFNRDNNRPQQRRPDNPPLTQSAQNQFHRTNFQNKENTRGGYQSNQDSNNGEKGIQMDDGSNHWGQQTQQQNVPPRFAKLGRGDGPKGRNDVGSGYRGGGRFDGGGGHDNKPGSLSNENRPLFKENNQGPRGRGLANSFGESQDSRSSDYRPGDKPLDAQTEQRTYNDQRNSDYKKRTMNQGDLSKNNFVDQSGGRRNGGYQQNNSQPGYNDRTSTRNGSYDYDNRGGAARSYKGQPNNKPFSQQQPSLMPTPYPQQHGAQFPLGSGKQ